MKIKDLKELISENKNIQWFGIHHFKYDGNTESNLLGETFEPNKVWSHTAKIYQTLPLTLFKLILFHKSFIDNNKSVIVTKSFGRILHLELKETKDYIHLNLQFIKDGYHKNYLSNVWEKIEKENDFNNETLKNLFTFLSNKKSIDDNKSDFQNIMAFIENGPNIEFTNKSQINIILGLKQLRSLFIGTLLWPWGILIYDRRSDNHKKVRVGFVQSVYLKNVKKTVKYLSTSTYLRFYFEGLEFIWKEEKQLKEKALLKTAIISILIDSYAHNISAHSLAALKWWIELRHKMLDKRFKVGVDKVNLNDLLPNKYKSPDRKPKKDEKGKIKKNDKNYILFEGDDPLAQTTQKYYEALGLTDSTYNAEYYSLFDFLQFAEPEIVKDLFKFNSPVDQKESNQKFQPRFPVPIDYALYPFFRFLRDKGAFWSGVTRDMAFGGESKTWYKILWEDFANNPLYLGTIAKSEGITKININLEVKQDGKFLHKGRFVTIDMSIIDYEEKLSQDSQLDSQKYEGLLNNSVKDDTECSSCKDYLELDKYSKYAFVKLGKCFAKFRNILDDEENFRVFLPGGIVGEHALFTIFENTIRNIKHYKEEKTLDEIKKNGIDFWISIEENKLSIPKNNANKKPELFKVGVWLGHETKLITKEETGVVDANGKKETKPAEYLLFTITDNTLKPILDEQTGAPRMGGNSQDKACAAMLFNNKFSSVENRGENKNENNRIRRDREYFPWIRFATECSGKEYLLDLKNDTTLETIEKLKNEYATKFICNGKEGYLKKYFFLWRGEDVLDKEALAADDWENPARAKFLVNDKAWEDEDIIKARKNGVIRLLDESSKPKNIDELNKLYTKWLVKWIKNDDGYQMDFCSNTDFMLAIKIENEDIKFLPITNHTTLKKSLYLIHGNEYSYNCNVRSHGSFWNKFFDESFLNKDPKNLDQFISFFKGWGIEKQKKKKLLMLEFWEAVLSNVVIFDNRIALRVPKAYQEKRHKINAKKRKFSKNDMLQKDLSLFVYEEDVNRFNFWLRKINPCNKNANFLIIHLSFIESITDNSGHKYSEDTLDKFIEEKLDDVIYYKENNEKKLRDDFILVITSGRGRDKWRDSLKNKDTKYEKFTIFKPVESLLSAIEQGISYNDHFDIKYNLIKVLFGN